MSNTLNTPVEALETAYPLRVESYRLRRGSGRRGGPPRAATGSSGAWWPWPTARRRSSPSAGAAGRRAASAARDGAPGRTTLNGRELPSKWRGRLAAGDVLGIETPGGGGHGAPPA